MSVPGLNRSITRSMRSIPAMRPAIDLLGFHAAQAEAIEMLTWMSWLPLTSFPAEVVEALPSLAAQGLVEMRAFTGNGPATHARLTVARQGGQA